MRRIALFVVTITVAAFSVWAPADQGAAASWVTPVIQGYGRINPLPHAAYQPDARKIYRIVFDLTAAPATPREVNPALDRVARTVNLYAASGVPLNHLKFVAVAHGRATALALDDAHYVAAYGVSNPNLPLIALLRKHGVDVAVCGQAVAELGFQYDWIDPSVTLSLSALTTISVLEQEGYALMPL